MEEAANVLSTIFTLVFALSSLAMLILMTIYERLTLKQTKENHKKVEKLVDEKCKEIEDGIGKELAETKKENERLKKLCDRTLAVAEEQDKKLDQLQKENEQLKEKNKTKQSKK